jgi:hypothetical protein
MALDTANILEEHSPVEEVFPRVVRWLVSETTNLRERVLAALPKGRLGHGVHHRVSVLHPLSLDRPVGLRDLLVAVPVWLEKQVLGEPVDDRLHEAVTVQPL